MRQTELHLSEEDRSVVEGIRAKGLHRSRAVNRAHVLSCLDRGVGSASGQQSSAPHGVSLHAKTRKLAQHGGD